MGRIEGYWNFAYYAYFPSCSDWRSWMCVYFLWVHFFWKCFFDESQFVLYRVLECSCCGMHWVSCWGDW